MTGQSEAKQLVTRAVQHCIWLVVIYVLIIFLTPGNAESMRIYHLSLFEYRLVMLAVALPAMIVWMIAFIGYAKLRQYAHAIRKTPEGIYFDQLAEGCTWLAWSLPISSIIPALCNAIANRHSAFHPTAIIVSNYINMLLPLIAFSVIAGASRGMLASVRIKLSLANGRFIIAAFLVLGVLYCFFTFRRFDLTSLGSSNNPYFLPIWLMVLTVTVPYLYAWFVGMLATYEITLYSRSVQGVLYRRSLGLLVSGLLAVIFSLIALQYSGSVEPRVGHLVVDYRLALTSLFRIIGGIGFILLAMGSNRLKKIEEV